MQATRLKNVALGFSSNADIDKRTQKDNENKKEKEMDRGKEGSVGNISSRNSTELPPVRESLRSLRSEKARYSTAQYSTAHLVILILVFSCHSNYIFPSLLTNSWFLSLISYSSLIFAERYLIRSVLQKDSKVPTPDWAVKLPTFC